MNVRSDREKWDGIMATPEAQQALDESAMIGAGVPPFVRRGNFGEKRRRHCEQANYINDFRPCPLLGIAGGGVGLDR
jgi:hypothetical protein